MPQQMAARQLGLSLSGLKNESRKFGRTEWPHERSSYSSNFRAGMKYEIAERTNKIKIITLHLGMRTATRKTTADLQHAQSFMMQPISRVTRHRTITGNALGRMAQVLHSIQVCTHMCVRLASISKPGALGSVWWR